eukprot:CAMPEP_0170539764 /NCGR_PEP_ID=MMETSP0209-20121228/104186_1 /TAXON_ID=665100 ORGANISM="Litonotus pictus, Strain P1" /NCGR_SAMPLE_ID=MMETSP0209 /ASSEMBLY_ACC=CAM_ASM_000301 /LENGTH=120 /DNA_ID=CAMNT_0010841877 /DNA_START=405 /DNA_END=764 /DNA_ORIENTATION=-
MDYYEEGHILIVHGGKVVKSHTDDYVLSDTYILNLYKMEWYEVEFSFPNHSYSSIPRFAHNSIIFTDKLIIFGGSSDEKLVGSALFVVNLCMNKIGQLASYHQITTNYIEQGKVGKDRLE